MKDCHPTSISPSALFPRSLIPPIKLPMHLLDTAHESVLHLGDTAGLQETPQFCCAGNRVLIQVKPDEWPLPRQLPFWISFPMQKTMALLFPISEIPG